MTKFICDLVYLNTLLRYLISNFSINNQKIISSFLLNIHNVCSSFKDQILILNQVCFIERGIEELISTDDHNINFLINVRDPFSQFCDIEKDEFFFEKGDLKDLTVLGSDLNGIYRRAAYIDILILRCKEANNLKQKYQDKIYVSSFEEFILNHDIELKKILDLQGISSSDINLKNTTSNLREFNATKSKKNILDRDIAVKNLKKRGYNDYLIQKLHKLELEYKYLLKKES